MCEYPLSKDKGEKSGGGRGGYSYMTSDYIAGGKQRQISVFKKKPRSRVTENGGCGGVH